MKPKRKTIFLIVVTATLTHGMSADASANFTIPADTRQLVAVSVADWQATTGTMQRWERTGKNTGWQPVGTGWPVMVGRNGLAWGRSALTPTVTEGPHKREGDGKAPAGLFALTAIFGIDAHPDGLRLPYIAITDSTEAVDDPRSRYYNRIMDRQQVSAPDWNSAEKMSRIQPGYRWGVVVGHNPIPSVPGAGSCIFLHLWRQPGPPTVGCTVMSEANLVALVHWLDGGAHPLLLQLPAAEFPAHGMAHLHK